MTSPKPPPSKIYPFHPALYHPVAFAACMPSTSSTHLIQLFYFRFIRNEDATVSSATLFTTESTLHQFTLIVKVKSSSLLLQEKDLWKMTRTGAADHAFPAVDVWGCSRNTAAYKHARTHVLSPAQTILCSAKRSKEKRIRKRHSLHRPFQCTT